MLKFIWRAANLAGLLFLVYAAYSIVEFRVYQPWSLSRYEADRDARSELARRFPHGAACAADELERIADTMRGKGTAALVVIKDGRTELDWGHTDKKINSHSIRKSILSALYGIAIERGLIDQAATLADLGIDDRFPSLSPEQRQATVRNLLQSRSGIYHYAAAQTSDQRKRFPAEPQPPGAHWAYNNWDYNALGTIFENETGLSLGEAFEQWIAQPAGMIDFESGDVRYLRDVRTEHPSFPIWISARDLAIFGDIFVSGGRVEDSRIVPADWVAESTTPQEMTYRGGNGLMWWIDTDRGGVFASGTGTQKLYFDRASGLIIVHRVDTGANHIQNFIWFLSGKRVSSRDFFEMVDEIRAACE